MYREETIAMHREVIPGERTGTVTSIVIIVIGTLIDIIVMVIRTCPTRIWIDSVRNAKKASQHRNRILSVSHRQKRVMLTMTPSQVPVGKKVDR